MPPTQKTFVSGPITLSYFILTHQLQTLQRFDYNLEDSFYEPNRQYNAESILIS